MLASWSLEVGVVVATTVVSLSVLGVDVAVSGKILSKMFSPIFGVVGPIPKWKLGTSE